MLPCPRLAALVLAAGLVAACTAEEGPRATPSPPTSAGPSPGDGGPLDAVAGEEPLDEEGAYGQISEMTLDADGEPIVLYASLEDEPLLVSRRTGDTWDTRRLTDPPVQEFDASADAADDGTLVVSGFVDGRFSFTRIAPDGTVTTVPLAADLGAGDIGFAVPDLSPEGGTMYLGVIDRETQSGVLAVDPATGVVRAEYRFPTEAAGLVAPTVVRVAGDRVLVTVDRGVDTSEASSPAARTPWLARFDLALQPLGEVQLSESRAHSGYRELDVDAGGTAYIALAAGLDTPDEEIRVVAVAPDATAATTVATFPGEGLVNAMAVDDGGTWAYLAGLDNGPDPLQITVTPIDLLGGEVSEPVLICEGSSAEGMGITPDGRSLLLTASCRDRDVHPTLVTLR